jgi:hypothetical protein
MQSLAQKFYHLFSDHHSVECTINIAKEKRKLRFITHRLNTLYTPEIFQEKLLDRRNEFQNMERTDDVDIQVSIFNDNFVAALDECAPYITRKIRPLLID